MMPEKNKTILVVQTAFIGDVFLSIPFLLQIKNLYPEHQLILVCRPGLKNFFLNEKIVNEVWEIQKGDAKSYNQLVQKSCLLNIEHLFTLHRSFRSSWFSLRLKAQNKYGFNGGIRNLIFSRTAPYEKSWPDVLRQLYLLTAAGHNFLKNTQEYGKLNLKLNLKPDSKNSEFQLAHIPKEFQFKNNFLDAQSKKIALFPGSVWKTKEWTIEGYTDLAQKLIDEKYEVHIFGAAHESTLAEQIKQAVPEVFIETGKFNLYESILALKNYRLVICNDSSPSHFSAYLGIPVVAIFGPTVLDFGFRPWLNAARVVENISMDCRPCGPHGHKECPLGHHLCMKTVSSDMVFKAVLELIKDSESIY